MAMAAWIGALAVAGTATAEPVLRPGDRLHVIGDSITEQRLYSKAIATYLAACRPELQVDVRQLGWGGESLPGFRARMEQDSLRFRPTLVTLAYGMNDACALAPEAEIRTKFGAELDQILDRFAAAGVRVVVGGPGILTKAPSWRNSPETADDLDGRLAQLGEIARGRAAARGLPFADVHASMTALRTAAGPVHGEAMQVAGADGIHPQAAGHLAMALPFLRALGQGAAPLAEFDLDVRRRRATATGGHRVDGFDGRTLRLTSRAYPYVPVADPDPTKCARRAAELLGFHDAVNGWVLRVRGLDRPRCVVRWGTQARSFAREELERGINLNREFVETPFAEAFARVEARVDALQMYETLQVKMVFRSEEYKRAPEWRTGMSEQVRRTLVEAVRESVVPVAHTIVLEPER